MVTKTSRSAHLLTVMLILTNFTSLHSFSTHNNPTDHLSSTARQSGLCTGLCAVSRRQAFGSVATIASTGIFAALPSTSFAGTPTATSNLQSYPDFTRCPSGIQVKDVSLGVDGSPEARKGDRVVFEWSGYTIGYFGRPFQAKGGPTGGAFDKDTDYERTTIGSGTMVAGLEEGLVGMRQGQVRQIIVPSGALSYPNSDPKHEIVGPKPSTFSGQRALNFVLQNEAGTIDKTLLFNVKVVRVDVDGVVRR